VRKAISWSKREEVFVKRAGFVLMAGLAVHNKSMADDQFVEFLEIIKQESGDNRNFVRKSVNWALRAIGKSRNRYLYEQAIETAKEILLYTNNTTSLRGTKQSLDVEGDCHVVPPRNDVSVEARGLSLESAKAARFIAGDALREFGKDYIQKRF